MTPLSWALLAATVVLAPVPAASRARTRLRDRVPRFGTQPARLDRGLPLALDLAASALRAGQPLAAALQLAAPACEVHADEVARVGRLLALGADPPTAWQSIESPELTSLAAAARRSADSGVRLADAFERSGAELRAELRAAAEARAHRAGVWSMAPLGLCFLPAFVCLGIIPTVAGIASDILGG